MAMVQRTAFKKQPIADKQPDKRPIEKHVTNQRGASDAAASL